MGYAVISVRGNNIELLAMDALQLGSRRDMYERLEMIHTKVQELSAQFKPLACAVESPFFGKNVQSMLKLGRAQGVAIAAAMQQKISVTEYSPKKIKQSITGNGNASKEQVFKMLQRILTIAEVPRFLDASDALSVAVCHHYQTTNTVLKTGKAFKGWEDFINKNPGRAK